MGAVNKVVSKDMSRDNSENISLIHALNRSQAVIEFSTEGIIVSANENFLNCMKYDLSDIEGEHHRIFCDEKYSQSSEYKDFWKTLLEGEFVSGEFKRIDKNGRDVWIIASYNPILDENGEVYKIIKFATDVTDAKVELQARVDIMNMTSIVSESDLKGDILSVNDKFIEVSKYPKEELIGQPHSTTRHPDMPKEVFKELWSTIGKRKMFRGVIKNLAKDGTPYYVDAVIAPVVGRNGRPRKYLGVRYDITDTEIERQNMKGILRAIDGAFAYIEFDIKGYFQSCNQNFINVMGYEKEELLEKHHSLFCEKDYTSSPEYQRFWDELAQSKGRNGIFKRIKNDGTVVYLQAVYAPVTDETGRVVKVIKIATDITGQQEMLQAIQETAVSLSGASTELTATATVMSDSSVKTSEESESASRIASEVSTGVQVVATNIEEMVASIKEISRSTSESSIMAKTTLEKAQLSNTTVLKLGESSQEIGDVIKVISSIAQQTNLLALNATIEAARAGESGKGFAVVANEVKELAKQTAKATDDITQKIGAIQGDTKNAVEAIADISESVEKLSSISGVIAASVEEQTATTNEISRVVVDSKKGVERIADSIELVSQKANESSTSSSQTLEASRELAQLAERLASLSQNQNTKL